MGAEQLSEMSRQECLSLSRLAPFLFTRGLAVPTNSTLKPVTREQILTERKAVDIRNAAAYLGVSHKTIRRLIAAGKLPAYRVGGGPIRVLIPDVEALKEPIRPSGRRRDGAAPLPLTGKDNAPLGGAAPTESKKHV
jgi:excisionase family DNA binding protein